MKLLHVFTLCLLVSVSYAEENTTEIGKWPPWTHKTTTTTTTTPAPSPTTPTTTSTTEIPPTSTSTTPIPTTPTPTSPIPTTPTPTTPNPTTPTTPASSTTAVPPPKEWVVRDPATNHVCIIANMDVTFNLHTMNNSMKININPSNAKAEGGICGNLTSQTLEVVWPFHSVSSKMLVTFTEKDKHYFISGLELNLAYNLSDVIKVANFSSSNLTLFQTSVNTSYSCASTDIPEQKNDLKEHVDIKVTELHIEAFRTGNSTSFSSSHFCDGEVPDVVPLVVGICLAVLVLVVVVAYLIGRRRSQASGYLSM